jgi:hypothetical protein
MPTDGQPSGSNSFLLSYFLTICTIFIQILSNFQKNQKKSAADSLCSRQPIVQEMGDATGGPPGAPLGGTDGAAAAGAVTE